MDREAPLRTFPEQSEAGWKWLPYALLLAVTFALYGATLCFDFVWDDILYIHRNYRIHRLDLPHLYAFWTGTYLGHYAPVQHTFLALLYHFFGVEPFGYHLAQVLVHAASACLLFFVLQKMEMPRVAWVASLLFAVHPTSIETVAWVSETKSTLAFFFFLLSVWFFIRLRERERPREQWTDGVLAGLFLILSVLSKINTVVAPAIFLLYDYRQGASFRTLRWRSLGCFFLISAAFTAIHLGAFHGSPQRLEGVYYGGPGVHLMNLPLLLSFYVRMAVFPYPVSAWEMFPAQEQLNWLVALGWAGLLAVALLLLRTSRSTQFWALWFVVFLLPVLQIVPFPIWVADRYLYIPGIGLFVLVGRLFSHAWDRAVSPGLRWSLQCAMVAAIVVLGWRTLDHLPAWRN
ncbi:MAG TPA: glycosyltransferase family 39 protein, partial [Terriglobales bacterium]